MLTGRNYLQELVADAGDRKMNLMPMIHDTVKIDCKRKRKKVKVIVFANQR